MVSSTLTAESGVLCQADVDIATRATGVCPRVRFGNSGGVGWMVWQYILVIFFLVTDAVSLYTASQLQEKDDRRDIKIAEGQMREMQTVKQLQNQVINMNTRVTNPSLLSSVRTGP